jgi:hypothetical protein
LSRKVPGVRIPPSPPLTPDPTASLDQVDGWSDSGGSSASQTLSYDLNGNLIATSGRLTVHDSRNRLSAYSGNTYNASTGLPTGSSQTSTMHYDADGRVRGSSP